MTVTSASPKPTNTKRRAKMPSQQPRDSGSVFTSSLPKPPNTKHRAKMPSQRPRDSGSAFTSSLPKPTNTKRRAKMPLQRPRDSGSVFDRLYQTSTASSKMRKSTGPPVEKNFMLREDENRPLRSSRKVPPTKRKGMSSTQSKDGPVFSRLYEKGTASSVSKRKAEEGSTAPETLSRPAMKPKNHE